VSAPIATTRSDGRLWRTGDCLKVASRTVPSDSHTERLARLPRTDLPGGLTLVEAGTRKARRRGLSRLDALPGDHALLIRTPSVHTFGMRFALDLIWLSKDGTVVRVDRNVPAGRMRACLKARSVVETVAGRADAFVSAGVGTPGGEPATHAAPLSDELERDRGA